MAWVKDAPDKAPYQRRLAIWLTHSAKLSADRISELLIVTNAPEGTSISPAETLDLTGCP